VREIRTPGSARGVPGNGRPYLNSLRAKPMKVLSLFPVLAGVLVLVACRPFRALDGKPNGDIQVNTAPASNCFIGRGLTRFNRSIIDSHKQLYGGSCIPSSVEMVLKLLGRVPVSYYDLQMQWQNKLDGSFKDFDGKTVAGATFHQRFTMPRDDNFPLTDLFDAIHAELSAGRFVIVGLAAGDAFHNWVIYDEDATGEFLAVSKGAGGTVYERAARKVITQMKGTDIGIYRVEREVRAKD